MVTQLRLATSTNLTPAELRVPRVGGAGGSNNTSPPVSLSFPGDDRQRQQDEAARMRDRIAALLSDSERGQINV